ncbi:MAG TPA: hypothetical protein VLB12_12860 [Gemmatimonadales bacterium]|nr:hypothetical protein [Gemmatimonadales bacterium]
MNGTLLDSLQTRNVASGHFALRLDTTNASEITLLSSSAGGNIAAEVVSVFDTGLAFARKHLGPPKYEPFSIPIGVAASTGLFDWVASSWGPAPEASSGAVLGVDFNFNIKSETDFADAFVVETGIPALDAGSKEAGFLTVRFQPTFIEVKPGTGKLSLKLAQQKLWRTSNFRLQIEGLDCTKVSRIDDFTVTRKVAVVSSGSGGIALVPDKVEFPNLRITLSTASAQTWFDWHKSFVVNGNNGDAFERDGVISFLSNDLQTELSRIDLLHLGIIRLAPPLDESARSIARVTAELYCEEMRLGSGVNP